MSSRKSPARRNRLLINIGIQVFGQSHYLVPGTVLLNLRSDDNGQTPARIAGANYAVERICIRQDTRRYFSSCDWRAFVTPVVHGNGNEYWAHRGLRGQVVSARDSS